MNKIIIALLTMAVVLAGTAAIVNASGGSEREVAKSSAGPQKRAHLSGAPAHAAVNCRTLKCINQKLTKLNTGVFKCERIVPVTQYADFAAVGGGAITGIDYTQTGDAPTNFMVVDICGP
jgi:hypothetical protein